MLRMQISGFRQRLNESLYDAWDRYKTLEKQCPHHGFSKGLIAITFYNGLQADSRKILDSAANGRFDSVEIDEAWEVIEGMATHSLGYTQSSYVSPSSLSAISMESHFQQNTNQQIEDLKAQLASLKVGGSSSSQVQSVGAVNMPRPSQIQVVAAHCDNCGIFGHLPYTCQSTQEQVAAFQHYRDNNPYNNYQSNYNKPFQSYNNPPPQNPTPYAHPNKTNLTSAQPFVPRAPQPTSDMSDIRALMRDMQKNQADMMLQMRQMDQEKSNAIKSIETQLAQLASSQSTRQQSQLPSQPHNNIHTVNAIQLRSGTSYDGPPIPNSEYEVEDLTESNEDELHGAKNALVGTNAAPKPNPFAKTPLLLKKNRSVIPNTDRYIGSEKVTEVVSKGNEVLDAEKGNMEKGKTAKVAVQLPFPGRMKSKTLDTQFGRFMEVVKNLQVTVPFTELITQVPSYAKFMKDILTKKRSLGDLETVAFTEQCSALLQNKTPPKLKDPGSFSIPCTIGTHVIEKALCDLGASVSVMPYSLYKKLNMNDLKVTNITLKMADRSIKRPLGILEDVPVKVGKFFIPVDFIILDMAEDTQIPIILGRPFLSTAGANINVKNGSLSLEVEGEKVTFNMSSVSYEPMVETSYVISVVDEVVLSGRSTSLLRDPYDALMCLEPCAGKANLCDATSDVGAMSMNETVLGTLKLESKPGEKLKLDKHVDGWCCRRVHNMGVICDVYRHPVKSPSSSSPR